MSSVQCQLCGQQGHRASKCKELSPPKPDEFFSGGGGHSHSHGDDDEERANQYILKQLVRLLSRHQRPRKIRRIF